MFIVSIIHGYLSNVIATKTVKGENTCVHENFLGNAIAIWKAIFIILKSQQNRITFIRLSCRDAWFRITK